MRNILPERFISPQQRQKQPVSRTMRCSLRQILAFIAIGLAINSAASANAGVSVRVKVIDPSDGKFAVTLGGYRHSEPWYLPEAKLNAVAGQWSGWTDLSKWPWHPRDNKAGGIA